MVLDFGLINSGLFPESSALGEGLGAEVENQIVWKDVGVGIVPVGGVVAWCKSLAAGIPPLLPNYVECNGQVLVDGDSPLNGATIPDLNGTNAANHRFLRGQSTSGGTGGEDSHHHDMPYFGSASGAGGPGAYGLFYISPNPMYTNNEATLPSYYEVVWVMRIK